MTNPTHKQENDLKAVVKLKLKEIADALLEESPDEHESIGLLDGHAGIMLFLFHYSRFTADDTYSERAVELLYKSMDLINAGKTDFTYSMGISGFAWTLEYLAGQGFMEPITAFHQLDEGLCTYMLQRSEEGDWDPLHGGLGVAWYLFERKENPDVRAALEKEVEILNRLAEADTYGLKWRGNLADKNESIYNLGLAHGIPGIIVFLARCKEENIHPRLAKELLQQAISYLLSCKSSVNPSPNLYPIMMQQEGAVFSERLAWCYGDPGLLLALKSAHAYITSLDAEIRALVTAVAKRRVLKENKIFDACLCHGTAGLIPIWMTIKADAQSAPYLTDSSTNYWVDQTLKMGKHSDGLAGYLHHTVQSQEVCLTRARGLLDGIAGTGMCLISYLTGELAWTRALFMH